MIQTIGRLDSMPDLALNPMQYLIDTVLIDTVLNRLSPSEALERQLGLVYKSITYLKLTDLAFYSIKALATAQMSYCH